jgi:hypothetical protein
LVWQTTIIKSGFLLKRGVLVAGFFSEQQLALAVVLDEHQEVEHVFVLVVNVTFFMVHFALVEEVVHVAVSEVPLQKPQENFFQL